MTKSKKSMSPAGSMWALRNIQQETITAAKMSAKKEDKPVYVWVSEAIMKHAQETLKGNRNVAKQDDIVDMFKELSNKIEELSDRQKKSEERRGFLGIFRK